MYKAIFSVPEEIVGTFFINLSCPSCFIFHKCYQYYIILKVRSHCQRCLYCTETPMSLGTGVIVSVPVCYNGFTLTETIENCLYIIVCKCSYCSGTETVSVINFIW